MRIDPHQTNIVPPNIRAEPRSFIASTNAPFASRRLRLYDTANVVDEGKDEERVGISDLWKIAEKWAFNGFLKLDTNLKEVFTKLHLADAGVKVDDNPVFIRWLEYVNKYEEKMGMHSFSDDHIFELLRQTKSEDDLVSLFQTLRKVPNMKDLADTLQRAMFNNSPSSQKLMNEIWLKHQVTHKEVFKIFCLERDHLLDVDNKMFLGWLRYTEFYRAKLGANSFFDFQTMHFLLDVAPFTIEEKFGKVFQLIKEIPDLKKLGESLQAHLFTKLIHVEKEAPKEFGNRMVDLNGGWRFILRQSKGDANFQTLEAYTLKYAEELGGPAVLKEVKTLFANNDPEAAVAAAVKVS